MIKLRLYQVDSINAVKLNFENGIHRQVIHMPTAAGKTIVFSSIISEAIRSNPKTRILILAFSCDLLGQARDKLLMVAPGLQIGLVDMANKEFGSQVVVSSVQSARLPGNLDKLKAQGFTAIICDECHRFACESARLVLNELGFSKEGCESKKRLLLGFSATPFRQDGKGLGEIFDKITYSITVRELIDQGYLCPPVGHKVVTDLDLSKVAVQAGDFCCSALSKVMNTDTINELIVTSYLEKAAGRKTIAFATSIEHSINLASWFKRYGIAAEAIHSNLSISERTALKTKFRDGHIEVLVNPVMLIEGYDEPSVSCVIIARPTQSPGLFQQMSGRGLRLHPTKHDCIILDFGDKNHSLCNVGVLLEDEREDEDEKKGPVKEKMERLADSLPENINPKLKQAIIQFDLLGDSFTWQKDRCGNYTLTGCGGVVLCISKSGSERYRVTLGGPRGNREISSGLDFSYSFGAAEDFVRANRSIFSIADLEASWRKDRISKKQKILFVSCGYKNGIEDLTKGQASIIISSGILQRRSRGRCVG